MSIELGRSNARSGDGNCRPSKTLSIEYLTSRRPDAFLNVAWAPDGKTVACASDDSTVKLWDASSGRFLRSLEDHSDEVASVAWSADGEMLASGSNDRTVKLWDANSGKLLRTLRFSVGRVASVAWAADGKTLACAVDDGAVMLWAVNSGEFRHSLQGHDGQITSVAWSADGRILASGSADKTVKLWDPNRGMLLDTLEGHSGQVTSVAWSVDGKTLASGSTDKTVKLWEVRSAKLLRSMECHGSGVTSVAWSANGTTLAGGLYDQTVKLWDARSGRLLSNLAGHSLRVTSVAWSSDGNVLASASADSTVKLWEARSGELLHSLEGHAFRVATAVWSADGNTLASGSSDTTVKLWDASNGKLLHVLKSPGNRSPTSLAWSIDGKTLASGSSDKTVKLWDVSTGKVQKTLVGHRNWVRSVAWSRDGKTLASGSDDKMVNVWEVSSGKLLYRLEGHGDWIRSVAWSVDGKRLASGSDDNTVKIWDPRRGVLLRSLDGRGSSVASVAWSPDGKTLASGSGDQIVRLWEASTGKLLRSLEGHPGLIRSLQWSADGRVLTSQSDALLSFWELDGDTTTFSSVSLTDFRKSLLRVRFVERRVPQRVFSRTRLGDPDLTADYIDLPHQLPAPATALSVSAKVVLVGQSEVGKSCLALQLAEGRYETQDTTHAMKLWRLSPSRIGLLEDPTGQERREVVIWDLGGQPEYRLVHQLFLHDTSLALMMFDPTRGSAAFDDVREWNLRLDKQRSGHSTAKLLVGTKLDDATAVVDANGIEQLRVDCGAKQYLATSAKAARGIQELRAAIAGEISWNSMARTTTPLAFQRVRDAVSRHQQAQEVVLLYRDLVKEVREESSEEFDESVVERIVQELCLQGLIAEAQLPSGRALLLQIGYVEQYAGSIVLAAKNNQRGVPAIDEALLRSGQMDMPRMRAEERLHPIKELVALQCVVQLLLTRNLALRHEGMLVFPSEFAVLSQSDAHRFAKVRSLYYDITGPVDNIYASLVVKLAMHRDFGRARMAKNRSEYDLPGDVVCGVRLRDQVAGLARIDVYFSEAVPEELRDRFTAEVARHLQDSGFDVKELLAVVCGCGYEFDDQLIRSRIAKGNVDVACPSCDRRVPILKGALLARTPFLWAKHDFDDPGRRDMQLQPTSTVRPTRLFIAYSHADEKYKNSLIKHLSGLRSSGAVLTWHDRDIDAGDDWEREIHANLEQADLILLLISADFLHSQYCTEREMRRALQRNAEGSARVIPILVRPVVWGITGIAKLQALPKDLVPITKWPDQDDAFVNVVQGIQAAIEQKMRPALAARPDQPLVWPEQPKPPIRILHLSDLHMHAEADPALMRQPLLADLRELGIEKLDCLVISGDLTQHADEREFERVHQLLSGLLERLQLSFQRCIVVPGNHDVSWDVDVYAWQPERKVDVHRLAPGSFKPQGDGFLLRNDAAYPQRFANFGKFYHQLRQEAYGTPADQQFGTYLFEELGIQFIALNSACEIDDQFPKRASINPAALAMALESAAEQIRQARQCQRLQSSAQVLRLGVWHHPLNGTERIQQDAFVGQLQGAGVKLCLHGHVHEDHTDRIRYYDSLRKLHAVAAGSFGGPVRSQRTPRLYNLLEVQRDHSRVRVHTRCLNKDGDDWEGWTVWPGDAPHVKHNYYDVEL